MRIYPTSSKKPNPVD